MGKPGDDSEPGFSFAKLDGADNYKKWAREMRYSLESAGLWDHTLPNAENPKPVPILLKGNDFDDDAKVDRQEKRADKITAWNKNNLKCKGYLGRMCLGHIQQEFQAVKTDWLAHELWEWLKKRYTLQNTASKWATITSVDELSYASCKNMAEYRSKYYALKASILEQKITIEDALKIRMLNNLGPAFKTYLTVVNDRMRTDEKLEDDEILFKAIEEEETRMKADQKASANFASTRSQGNVKERKFVEWPKCKKCGCKHLSDVACNHAEDQCGKCHKKGHISRFHDAYVALNKDNPSGPDLIQSSDSNSKTRTVTCVTRVVVNKMTEISHPQNIIADSGTTQHLIANRSLIQDYYDDYSEYQTGSGEVLPSYGKGTLCLPLDNGILRLLDVWYAPDLGFNLVSTIQLGRKGVEVWLRTANNPSQVLHNGAILGYLDPTESQYVFRLQNPSAQIVNSAQTNVLKQETKPGSIELWHARMGHLSYASLSTLKGLSTGMNFQDKTPDELCSPCKGGSQTRQPSKIPMAQSTEFLARVHSDLEGPFPPTRQGYQYYISFLEESTGLIDIELLKFKDDALLAFKNYRTLREKQSNCQLKVFHTDGGGEYKGEFDAYLKENGIYHESTAPYSPEQNGKAERLNRTVMGPVRALLIHMQLPKSLWAEIAKAVVYLRNRSPIRHGTTTAFKNLKGEKSYLGHLRILGCRVWVHIPKEKRKKLDERSYQGIFVGYEGTNQYRVYDPRSGQVSITRDLHFDETHCYDRKDLVPKEFADEEWHEKDDALFANPSDILDANEEPLGLDPDTSISTPRITEITESVGDSSELSELEDDEATPNDQLRREMEEKSRLRLNEGDENDTGIQSEDEAPVPRRSLRIQELSQPRSASANIMRSTAASHFIPKSHVHMVTVLANLSAGYDDSGSDQPLTLKEAMASAYWIDFEKAMLLEFRSLIENGTWEYTDVPAGRAVLTGRWVFKIKKDRWGHILKFKARWVAHGYKQQEGLDYTDTFASVVKPMSWKTMMGVSAKRSYRI